MLWLPQMDYVGRGCHFIDGQIVFKHEPVIQSGQNVIVYAPSSGIGKIIAGPHYRVFERHRLVLKPCSELSLHSKFIKDVETLSREKLQNRYGTHVLTMCHVGGFVSLSDSKELPEDAFSRIHDFSSHMYPAPIQSKDSMSLEALKAHWEQLPPSQLSIIRLPECMTVIRLETFLSFFAF